MSDRADELLRRVVIEWDSPDYKGMRLQTVNEIRAYLSENQPEVVTIRYQNVDGLEVAWINERKCVPEDRSVAQINDAGRRETQPIAMTGDVKNDPEASGLNSARESRDRSRRETASADPASPHQPIAATPQQKLRERFDHWYTMNAFDLPTSPLGSRDSAIAWSAWVSATEQELVRATNEKTLDGCNAATPVQQTAQPFDPEDWQCSVFPSSNCANREACNKYGCLRSIERSQPATPQDQQTAQPVAWIATHARGMVLHFGVADGWQVDAALFDGPSKQLSGISGELTDHLPDAGKGIVTETPLYPAVQPIPRDPTQAMMEAGWKAYYATPTPRMIGPIWIAMHDAFTKGSGGE